MNPSTPIAPKEGQQTADWRKLADDLANEIVTEVPDLAPEMILNFAEKYSARLVARCAELGKDKERLDWLQNNKAQVGLALYGPSEKHFAVSRSDMIRASVNTDLRAAIDAALALKPEGKPL